MDIKKAAAPGRKTTRKSNFKGSKLVDGIDYDVESRRRAGDGGGEGEEGEEEVTETAAVSTTAAADAVAVASLEEEERIRQEVSAKEALAAKAEAEAARVRVELEALKMKEAQMAAQDEEDKQREAALEERRQRRAQQAAERAQQDREQQQQHEATLAAAQAAKAAEEEEARVRAAAKEERRLQREREAEEAEARRLAEEAEAEERRRVALAAAEAEAAEELRQREAALAEKRARRAREAEERAAEERAREEAEAEAERVRQEAEAVEVAAAIEEEKARREALRVEREALAAAEAAAEAEAERKLREQRLQEALAAAATTSAVEDAALLEKKRRAEEQRRKRAMFLSDVDNFSESFESQTAAQKEARELAAAQEAALLQGQLSAASGKFVAPTYRKAAEGEEEEEEEEVKRDDAVFRSVPDAAAPVPQTSDAASIRLTSKAGATGVAANLDSLSSSLFGGSAAATAPPSVEGEVEEEVLRSATRIGGLDNPKKKSVAKGVVVAVSSSARKTEVDDDDLEEGEGELGHLSNFLTRQERMTMSAQEKASWRAKQGDLHNRRHEFHGAVTYAFDGIFSWQMYGSAEAIDEAGRSYTEYLMRCQWGTTFDNLQPWISARRYREFDILDTQLRKLFPSLAKSLPMLPQKDFFRALESNVVQKRRTALEEYMTKLVSSMPSILRSDQLNEFLGIQERIVAIRARIQSQEHTLVAAGTPVEGPPVPFPTQLPATTSPTTTYTHPHSHLPQVNQRDEASSGGGEEEIEANLEILSMDAAERIREETNARALDEDELGHLEEDVRDLGIALKKAIPNTVARRDGPVRALLASCCQRWPRLRATAVLGVGVDFSLIPRAMQTEEDLVAAANEYRSLRMAHSLC